MAIFTTATVVSISISVALAIASAAATMAMQAQAQAQQQRYQSAQQQQREREIAANYALTIESYNRETTQIQASQRQADEGAVQKDIESSLQSARAQGTARTAAGEAGVSGLSVDALLGDFMGQEAKYRDSVYSNLENQRAQSNMEILGAQQKGSGRIQQIQPYIHAPIAGPDYVGAALRVGGSAFDAYNRTKAPSSSPGTTPPSGGTLGSPGPK